jgi:hypothetical protein
LQAAEPLGAHNTKEKTMEEEIDQEDTITMKTLEIYDQSMAAYAIATGVKLVKVIPQPTNGWVTYEFDDTTGGASRALGEWSCGKAMVRAREFASAIRQVKRLVYS